MQTEEVFTEEDFLENNPNFSFDFLYYCDNSFKRIIHENQKKKEARKEYQHRYYMEVTKKKRKQKREESL